MEMVEFDLIIIGGSYAGMSAAVAGGNLAGAMANMELARENLGAA